MEVSKMSQSPRLALWWGLEKPRLGQGGEGKGLGSQGQGRDPAPPLCPGAAHSTRAPWLQVLDQDV